jgi:hypothetical protein
MAAAAAARNRDEVKSCSRWSSYLGDRGPRL